MVEFFLSIDDTLKQILGRAIKSFLQDVDVVDGLIVLLHHVFLPGNGAFYLSQALSCLLALLLKSSFDH